ncbi:hypothetical protein LTR15_012893 [Elasticomyces elasticus]|nr:hypothetical protein LTR15_012893 [Elasticomyces elasticus]
MANSPVPQKRLQQICNDACDSALSTASAYDHDQTAQWNNGIINSILKALISESTSKSTSSEKEKVEHKENVETTETKYKFCVNSTIIQHLSDPRPAAAEGATASEGVEEPKKVGRRGMHSASGAYWNNEKDGMWSHKYEGGEGKGMDIVVSVMWIAV